VFGLLVWGIPKPLEPGGAGMVTVGTSCFFPSVCAMVVWFKLQTTNIAAKTIPNHTEVFFLIIFHRLVYIKLIDSFSMIFNFTILHKKNNY
jgi:hypothetical protein